MNLVKTRFSLDDFKTELARVPIARLQIAQLQDWISRFDLDDLKQVTFSEQSYTRTLLYHTPQFNLLLLGWLPGQCSTVHDHADSLNVTRVCGGVLTSRLFERKPLATERCWALSLGREEALGVNALAAVDRHQIHQLANLSDEKLVTLHLYTRPLQEIQVYCPDGRLERVQVSVEAAEVQQ